MERYASNHCYRSRWEMNGVTQARMHCLNQQLVAASVVFM